MKLDKSLSSDKILATDNIAKLIGESDRMKIARIVAEMAADLDGKRGGWLDNTTEIEKLRCIDLSVKTSPWNGASNAKYPLSIDSELRLASRLYTDIIKGDKICKGEVLEDDPDGRLQKLADKRVSRLNRKIMKNPDSEYSENMDELFQKLSAYGTVFQKVYYDDAKGEICFDTVDARDVVVDNDLPRLSKDTDVIQKHILNLSSIQVKINNGYFIDYEYKPELSDNEENEDKEFLEAHICLDLDNDGVYEPYIIYVDEDKNMVVGAYKRYTIDDIKKSDDGKVIDIKPLQHFICFRTGFNLDNAFYHYGISGVLFPLANTINALLQQQIDVASLSAGRGIIVTDAVRIRGGEHSIKMNQNTVVSMRPGSNLSDNVHVLPTAQNNPMVLQLMEMLITLGVKITGVVETLSMDTAGFGNMKSTVALALIEKGVQNYSALYQRIYRSMTQSFQVLDILDKRYFPDMDDSGVVMDDEGNILGTYAELAPSVIMPQADPVLSTDMQKAMRINALMELKDDPNINDRQILEDNLRSLNLDVEKYMPPLNPNPPPSPEMIQLQQQLQIANEQLRQKDHEIHISSEKVRLEHEREMIEIQQDYEIDKMEASAKLLDVENKSNDLVMKTVTGQLDNVNKALDMDLKVSQYNDLLSDKKNVNNSEGTE